MKHCRVSAFARVARFIAFAAVALGLGANALLAQSATGKLEGRVRDQAGAPIANAQVYVVGTAYNAITNPQGYYFINNIPSGTVSVRAAFIGYKSTQVEGVKMLAGQTITVDGVVRPLAAAAQGRSLFGEIVVRSAAGAVLGTGSVVIGGTGAATADAPAQGAAPAPTTGTAPAAPVEDLVVTSRSKGETRGVSPAGVQ